MQLRRNKSGSLIGENGGVRRIAAHTYEVLANSHPHANSTGLMGSSYRAASMLTVSDRELEVLFDAYGSRYLVYVESISPKIARCQCADFIHCGTICKHGEDAIQFEKLVKAKDPAQYMLEKRLQRKRLDAGRMRAPYSGSARDEQ